MLDNSACTALATLCRNCLTQSNRTDMSASGLGSDKSESLSTECQSSKEKCPLKRFQTRAKTAADKAKHYPGMARRADRVRMQASIGEQTGPTSKEQRCRPRARYRRFEIRSA